MNGGTNRAKVRDQGALPRTRAGHEGCNPDPQQDAEMDQKSITYEAHQRHAEIVIKEMNMKKANAVSTPTVPEPSDEANSRLSSHGSGDWLLV